MPWSKTAPVVRVRPVAAAQRAAQLGGGHRVHAHFEEVGVGADAAVRRVAEQRGGLGAHQPGQHVDRPGGAQPGQPVTQRVARGGGRRGEALRRVERGRVQGDVGGDPAALALEGVGGQW